MEESVPKIAILNESERSFFAYYSMCLLFLKLLAEKKTMVFQGMPPKKRSIGNIRGHFVDRGSSALFTLTLQSLPIQALHCTLQWTCKHTKSVLLFFNDKEASLQGKIGYHSSFF